jgi:hypothetical protein
VNQKPSQGGVYPLLNSSRPEFSNDQPTHEKLSSCVEHLFPENGAEYRGTEAGIV